MNEGGFRAWLDASYSKETAQTRFSGARRVEHAHGDLDRHYESDQMQALEDQLTYTREDEAASRANDSGIRIEGNVHNGLASLKQAVRCYGRYRDEIARGPTTVLVGGFSLATPR